MKGLDTNVLLRFLIRDDLAQWQIADQYIRDTVEAGEKCFLNRIVLCEAVWVLRRAYKLSREEVIDVLEQVLRGAQFEFEDKSAVQWAVQQMQVGQGDFADYLLGQVNKKAGCSETVTFDAKLQHCETFQILQDR